MKGWGDQLGIDSFQVGLAVLMLANWSSDRDAENFLKLMGLSMDDQIISLMLSALVSVVCFCVSEIEFST